MFPWSEPGPLEQEPGPDLWQRAFLADLGKEVRARRFDGANPVTPIQMAIASGHGIGKSTLFAWLHWWILATRANSKIRVTANTYKQLETTTWAEIQRWHKLLLCRDWFEVTQTKAWAKAAPNEWFSNPLTCAEENSEAFAGQHNKNSTSAFLFDESSLIPDKICEVAGTGLVDGEPMWFMAGNPTRNTGFFFEACFGNQQHRWNHRSIDSRTCKFPNKAELQRWIEDHGIESDRCRVRIQGLPPKQSETQLIGRDLIELAQRREIFTLMGDPLIAGVDIPDGGEAWFAVHFRRGLSARPDNLIPEPFRLAGSKAPRELMIAILAEMLADQRPSRKISMMFIDAAYGAPIVERLRTMGYRNVIEVSFGDAAPDPHYGNMRAYMWAGGMKDWLSRGAIDPEDKRLAVDLMGPGFFRKVGGDGALMVESKKDMRERGVASPDYGDALALTFASPVRVQTAGAGRTDQRHYPPIRPAGEDAWMGAILLILNVLPSAVLHHALYACAAYFKHFAQILLGKSL